MKAIVLRYNIAVVLSLVINAALIMGMPFLLRFSSQAPKIAVTNPIRLSDYRRPTPPPPKKKEFKRQAPPGKVHPKIKSMLPKIDASSLSMVDVPLSFDLGLSGGMDIALGVKIWNELDVDQKPVALFRMRPSYPLKAKKNNTTGRVEFRFLVDRDGRVKEVEILDSTPHGLFDQATREAVMKWRFQPAKVKGAAVACWAESAIDYELE
ncbi:MAG: energy transducer TonB [Thermodesulfobacteriota bacterium]|nr:energy transducer TonB [Thermodesulfobacteriota bacterium]